MEVLAFCGWISSLAHSRTSQQDTLTNFRRKLGADLRQRLQAQAGSSGSRHCPRLFCRTLVCVREVLFDCVGHSADAHCRPFYAVRKDTWLHLSCKPSCRPERHAQTTNSSSCPTLTQLLTQCRTSPHTHTQPCSLLTRPHPTITPSLRNLQRVSRQHMQASSRRRPYGIRRGSPTMREALCQDLHTRGSRSMPEALLYVLRKPDRAGGTYETITCPHASSGMAGPPFTSDCICRSTTSIFLTLHAMDARERQPVLGTTLTVLRVVNGGDVGRWTAGGCNCSRAGVVCCGCHACSKSSSWDSDELQGG